MKKKGKKRCRTSDKTDNKLKYNHINRSSSNKYPIGRTIRPSRPSIKTDKPVQIGLLIQPEFLLQPVFRLRQGFGCIIEDGELLLAREIPLDQAADFLFMAGDPLLLFQIGQDMIEKDVCQMKQLIPFLAGEVRVERIVFQLDQHRQDIRVGQVRVFGRQRGYDPLALPEFLLVELKIGHPFLIQLGFGCRM